MRAFCRWREVAREHLLQLVAAKTDATAKSAQETDSYAEMMRHEHRKLVKRLQKQLQEEEVDKSDLLRHLEQETQAASAATQDALRLRRQLEELDQEARAMSVGLLWEKSERERERMESEHRHRELLQQVDEQQRAHEQQAFIMHNQNLALSAATQQALEGAVSDVLGFGSGGGGGWSLLSQGNNGHDRSNSSHGPGQQHWSHFTTVGGGNSRRGLDVGAGGGGGGAGGAGGGAGTGGGDGGGGEEGGVGTGFGGDKMGKVPYAELDVLMESVSRSLSTHIKASQTSVAMAAGGGSAAEGYRGSRGGGLRAGGGGGGGGGGSGSVWESDSESSAFPSNISSRWSSPMKL